MWRKLWQATLIATALVLALTAVAGAKPPGDRCPGHPSCTPDTTVPDSSTTTEAPAEPWTCVARARNGASAWDIGQWVTDSDTVLEYFDRATLEWLDAYPEGLEDSLLPVPAYYRTYVDERSGVPACFDIHPAHFDVTNWRVAWSPHPDSTTNEKGKLGGLKMQFEREVHGDVYWEYIARSVEPGFCETDPPTEVGAAFCATETDPLDQYEDVGAWQGEPVGSLVFVAMPSHRDNWVFAPGHHLTITPQP